MGSDVLLSALWLCLLPVIVTPGVIRQTEENEDESSCKIYTLNDLLYADCSDQGLTDRLPESIDYTAHVLLLSNNNFGSFPSELSRFTRLQHLDLSSNQIRLPPDDVRNWQELYTLNLSNNNFEQWTGVRTELNIQILDLSKNKISSIDPDAFLYTPLLHFLDLSENRIYDLPAAVFASARSIDTLILSRNYFSDVPGFRSDSLKNVYFSNCQITDIDSKSLIGMSSLLHLDLSMNQIEQLPDYLSSNTLQVLDLGYNEISDLTDQTFSSLPHLAVLDLRGNGFKEVWSTSRFSSNPFLREVFVKGNRWSCDGFSVNLLLTYEFLTKEPARVKDVASLICYLPSNVTQMNWQQAYIKTWHPLDSGVESYTTIAVIIGFIIGIALTSLICWGIMGNKSEPPRPRTPVTATANLNGNLQSRVELRAATPVDDLPPSYDEALLMPRLNSSFHSLPDFIDEEEDPRRNRRSRSIGDLTERRTRPLDRRSVRRTIEIRIDN